MNSWHSDYVLTPPRSLSPTEYAWSNLFFSEWANHFQKQLNISDQGLKKFNTWMELKGVDDAFFQSILNYPQEGFIQLPEAYKFAPDESYPSQHIADLVEGTNPCFDFYKITNDCTTPRSPLSPAGTRNSENWVNLNPGFKEAIHAPVEVQWQVCSPGLTFVGGIWNNVNLSPYPSASPYFGEVLDKLFDTQRQGGKEARVVIMHGLLDADLKYNQTLVGIQNTTWLNAQGFKERPSTELVVEGEKKGIIHTERQVTFALIDACGHECPADDPVTANKLVQLMLGQVEEKDLVG